ncbi:branched-chain amino acid transport system permease protein [Aquamicrobium terrae]
MAWVALTVAMAAGTWILKGYSLFVVSQAMAYTCALWGLTIITGRGRMVTVGHGAFFAIGAYCAAISITSGGLHYVSALLLAALVCFALGYIFALPAVRLDRHNLAIATLALAMSAPQVAKRFSGITGGSAGIMIPGIKTPFGMSLTSGQWLYLFSVLVTAVCFVATVIHVYGHRGRMLTALADNEFSAAATGINVGGMKAYFFAVGCALAGAGGALSALQVQFVNPESYGLSVSIALLTAIVIGGSSRLPGAILGAIFLIYSPNLVRALSANGNQISPDLVYGFILIAVLFVLPDGLASLPRTLTHLRKRMMARAPSLQLDGGEK